MATKSKTESISQLDENSTQGVNEQVQWLMGNQDWRSAIALIKKFPDLLFSNFEISWSLGWCNFKLERYTEARKYLLLAKKLAPETSQEYFVCLGSLGAVYVRLKNYRKAEEYLRTVLSHGDSTYVRMSLALALLAQGKNDQAERVHQEGIELRPEIGERYLTYGCFLSDVGRREEALLMYKKGRAIRRQPPLTVPRNRMKK